MDEWLAKPATAGAQRRTKTLERDQLGARALKLRYARAALVFGFTRLVYGDSAIGRTTRGGWALWHMLGFVCVLGLIAAGAFDAHAQTGVLRGGVGETPRHPLASLGREMLRARGWSFAAG